MSVKVRKYKRGGWEVDIRGELADGTEFRRRRKSPVSSKSGSQRWGEDRERELFAELSKSPEQRPDRREVPTLEEFAPRFLENYARANRQKPSTVASKQSIIWFHLVPLVGQKQLDGITNEDVQKIKSHLHDKAPSTTNTVLTTLSVMLKAALDWDVIERMPCTIRLLHVPPSEAAFHDFEEYENLVDSSVAYGANAHVLVLLGGEAGLRMGEMIALEWDDVEFAKMQLHVNRSDWNGHVTVPKGGRPRRIPMTQRLSSALHTHRHLRGSRVVCASGGSPLTKRVVQRLVAKASSRANLEKTGVHILRHTFCSHLAMRGAPAKAIQELAGHRDLEETQRYMHLSPAAIEGAIRLLDHKEKVSHFGDMLETVSAEIRKTRD